MNHPFRIEVPDKVLDRIRAGVAEYPWHEMPDDGGRAYGTNPDYMKELWQRVECAVGGIGKTSLCPKMKSHRRGT